MYSMKKRVMLLFLAVCVLISCQAMAVEPFQLETQPADDWVNGGDLIYASYESGFVSTVTSKDGGDLSLDRFIYEDKILAVDGIAPSYAKEDVWALNSQVADFFLVESGNEYRVYLLNSALNEYKYVGILKEALSEDGTERTLTFAGRSYGEASPAKIDEYGMKPYRGASADNPAVQDVIFTGDESGFYACPGDFISAGSVYLSSWKEHLRKSATVKAALLREEDGKWNEVASREVTSDKTENPFVQLSCSFIVPGTYEEGTGHYRVILSANLSPSLFDGKDGHMLTPDDWQRYGIYSSDETLWPITGIYMGLNLEALQTIAAGIGYTSEDSSASTRTLTTVYTPIKYETCDYDANTVVTVAEFH